MNMMKYKNFLRVDFRNARKVIFKENRAWILKCPG